MNDRLQRPSVLHDIGGYGLLPIFLPRGTNIGDGFTFHLSPDFPDMARGRILGTVGTGDSSWVILYLVMNRVRQEMIMKLN